MTKRKVEVPQHARDCKTLADKVGFSLKVRAEFDALRENPWAGPEEFSALMDKYGDDYEKYPWAHPTWAEEWARAERTRREILRTLGDEE
jgi:hypothetical protein